jgi:hypothetical protein
MDANARPRHRRQRRGAPACDGTGQGRGRRQDGARSGDSSLGARTATRALVALGAYVAQDVRDPDGVARPVLRRAALRMISSRRGSVRRLGTAYLRGDPPTPEELERGRPATEARLLPPVTPAEEPTAPVSCEAPRGAPAAG